MFQLLFGLLFSWALIPIPDLSSPVVDQAGVFTPAGRQQLEAELRQFQQTGKAQIQVLAVPTLEGEAIEDFSIRVSDQWKLGDAKKGNGVLIILATQDRRSRIEVGDGIEGELTDVQSKRILADVSRPFFQRGDYQSGLRAAALTVMDQLSGGDPLPNEYATNVQNFDQKANKLQTFLIFAFIFMALFSRIFGRRSMGRRRGFLGGAAAGWGAGTGWGSGGGGWGSGGGGGWSGGGGGFSGGGSSDSW